MSFTTVINAALITEIISGAKSLLGLFAEFPLNVFVIGAVAGVMWRQVKHAKKAAR